MNKLKSAVSLLALGCFVFLAFGSADSGHQSGSQAKKGTPPHDMEITPAKLIDAYDTDETAADRKYKGKRLKITGKVEGVDKDIAGTDFLLLDASHDMRRVQIYFHPSFQDDLAKLKKGQTVTVIGKCDGLGHNVLLKDGHLVRDAKNTKGKTGGKAKKTH